ncbi:SDR family oxidoreductase [Microbacterium sp. No. 7]|uniref:SDR family oxidoreductase n=1 Tax=Microbacterium sp. No. 7 TaxID=1714373 RepID=UPI0006D133BD|nr:SDR family oxidoreductase [Microbacterium sp. No. 7]ALJ18846.1 short-chain dehydrogenase [Microbacterium sp. No. 7]
MTGLAAPPPLGATPLPPGSFDGRTVLVTGGGTGIGKAIATEFGRLGAAVAVAGRDPGHRAAGVRAVEEAGGRALGIEVDVREPDAIAAAFDAVEAELGTVSVLVNNAAGNFPALARELSPGGWRAVTSIVLDGTYFCSREFARRLIDREQDGSIVSIAATYAWTGGPGTAASAAAKAGVVNLTQSLAVEWAPWGIQVNAIAPGLFPHSDHVSAMRSARPDGYAAEGGRIPAGRTGEVRELGWAAALLCSPYLRYVTGHTLVVDGGNWLRRGLRMPEFVSVDEQIAQMKAGEG